jgi:hypothetical protein
MAAGLGDHLWQSSVFCAAIWLCSLLARPNAAIVRLWMWRIAALKFLLPFAWLCAIGGWMGFPVPHSAVPAPAGLVLVFSELEPLASPGRVHQWTGWRLLLAMAAALAGTGACAWAIHRRLGLERQRVLDEAMRRERDVNDIVSRPGFFAAALLTACASCVVAVPMLAGAVDDRERRHEHLLVNSLALRRALVDMTVAAPGQGLRFRVDADAHGASIRNVSIHELVAIVYGVKRHAVLSNQMMSGADPDLRPWMHWPRYNLRVVAPIPEPKDFDPYALRQSVTKLLAERFGLEIYLNQDCQPPCGKYGVALAGLATLHP